jgi:hypothetical protein
MGGDYRILTMGSSTYGGVTLIPKVLSQAAGHRARGCYGSSHLNVPPIPSEVLKENASWNQAWKCPLEDTYGQNVTISPSVVFELPFLCRSRTSLHAYQVDVRGE